MNKFLKILLLANSVNVVSDNLLIPIFALFVSKLNIGVEFVGVLFSIQFISSTVFGFFVLRIKDRHNLDNKLLKLNYIIKALAWTALAFLPSLPILITAEIAIGFASAIGSPAFNSLISEHLDNNRHIKDWTFWELIFSVTTAVGSFLSGFFLSNFGFTFIFIAMALLQIVSLTIYTYQ